MTIRNCLMAILPILVAPLSAQTWLDYDQALSPQSLLRTANAAALTAYQPTDSSQWLLADAKVGVATEHGHLAPLHVMPSVWRVDAAVRSIARMSRRVVLRGGMDYSNSWGHQANGSVWISPDERPFDITETADSTRGDMTLERYHISGEVGVMAVGGLSLGARFDYTTASSAKKKDPRHTNTLMQMDASLGAAWQQGGWTIGANYLLQRTTEALQFSTYGRTDRVYSYLIDQGAAFGRDEQSDGKGYVGTDYEKPWLDMRHGVALQLGYASLPWNVVIEGEWMHRHGHYGLQSPAMIDFNRHQGDEWHLRSWWQHATPQHIHRVTAHWSHYNLKDNERTYRIITTGGVTDVNYYDDREISQRQVDQVTLTYDLQWGIQRCLATWQAQARAGYRLRTVTASIYPYYRWQQTHFADLQLEARRNWVTTSDYTWSLTLMGGWGDGGGDPAHDGCYDLPSDGTEAPQQHDDLLMSQHEWLTAQRINGGIAVRWTMPLSHHHLRLYAEGEYCYVKALNTHYLPDSHRHTTTLTLGCLF